MKNTRLIAVILSVFMLIAVCCGCGEAQTSSDISGAGSNESLDTITVTIKFEDGEEKELKYETDKQYLADVLFEDGIVTEAEYKSGFYTYIDGVRADYNADGAWWSIYENGESAMVGMNELQIDDNDEFEIVHTPA